MEEIIGGIVVLILIALLVTYWQFFLTVAIIIGIIYAFYKWSQAETERRRQEALTRAKEIQVSAQHLRDDVQRIVGEVQHPAWDHQQGGKTLSTVFSGSADSAILLGELIAGAVTETGKDFGKADSGSM